MDLPTELPAHLRYVSTADSEDELFQILAAKTPDLISFFESASDDETWSDVHSAFITKALNWLTEQTYKDRLSKEFISRIARSIHRHSHVLMPFLNRNITVKLADAEISENNILLSAASNYFRQTMIYECRDKDLFTVTLNVGLQEYLPIHNYINTGSSPELQTMGQEELTIQVRRAIAWEIDPLSQISQKSLSKYITDDTAIDMLIKAKQERWVYFAQHCAEYINSRDWGFGLAVPRIERLSFEFRNFQSNTLEYFTKLKPLITDIACKGDLPEDPQFGTVLKQCNKLIGVDISKTLSFSQQFMEIPKTVEELNLSECPWLSGKTLQQFFKICPDLKQLDLSSDVHLNFSAWGELSKLKQLKRLSVAQCHQIQDSDLTVIAKGCVSLTDLSLKNCSKIGEKGFLDLAKNLSRLVNLDLSRCALSDNAAVEISSRCRNLARLDISSCNQLTEKGILGIVKHCHGLQELDISRCRITQSVIDEIKRIAPLLNLLV